MATATIPAAGRPAPPRAPRAPPLPDVIQRGEIRKLLLARTEPFPVTEPAVSRHQVTYEPPPPTKPVAGVPAWTAQSRRVGVIGLQAGMTADWDKWGVRHALTVLRVRRAEGGELALFMHPPATSPPPPPPATLQLEDVIVTGQVLQEVRGYTALQVGAGTPKPSTLDRARAGLFASRGVAPRRVITEFRVTPDALLPVGASITARHFVPGQMVKVSGTTQGKGFQGAMKRHGFSGQSASHGNSLSHRALGSTGCRHDPGRVIKGKKMPGQMGGDTISIDVKVFKVDIKANLVYVKGPCLASPAHTCVSVTPSSRPTRRRHPFPHIHPPPSISSTSQSGQRGLTCHLLMSCSSTCKARCPQSMSVSHPLSSCAPHLPSTRSRCRSMARGMVESEALPVAGDKNAASMSWTCGCE